MKLKLLTLFAAIAFVFSACNQDELDSLDKRLDKVESRIGNDPITFKYSSSYTDGTPIVKDDAYFFKSTGSSTHYMEDYGDGTYGVYVERFPDVDWNEYVWLYFDYNPTTKEVSNQSAGVYFRNSNFDRIYLYSYPGYVENNVAVTVKSFNTNTGDISVTVRATTTNNSDNNNTYVDKKAQTLDLSFKGQLQIFVD